MLKREQVTNLVQELSRGRQRLAQMVHQLQAETKELDSSLGMLMEKRQELETVKQKLEEQGEVVDCDKAVVATAPIYNQLFEVVALLDVWRILEILDWSFQSSEYFFHTLHG